MPAFNKGLEFDRDRVLNKYRELANLDAVTTKGNITGQLKALDSLCQELTVALAEKPNTAAKRTPVHEIYRSGWMPNHNA